MLACFNVWFTHHATTMNLNRLAKLMQTRWCCTLRTAWSVASWYVLNELAHPLLVHSCACLTTLPDGCRASDAAICHDEPTTQGTGERCGQPRFLQVPRCSRCFCVHGQRKPAPCWRLSSASQRARTFFLPLFRPTVPVLLPHTLSWPPLSRFAVLPWACQRSLMTWCACQDHGFMTTCVELYKKATSIAVSTASAFFVSV